MYRPLAVFGRGLWLRCPRLPQLRASSNSIPFESEFDQDQLVEARAWHKTCKPSSLPRGKTSFSRASGPGGQHVNKTESKATTTWTVHELAAALPRMLQGQLRTMTGYYVKRSDCIMFQAEDHRSREANMGANRQKLFDTLQAMYRKIVPGETSAETHRKYHALEKAFHAKRLMNKAQHSAKKASRRGRPND